MNHNFRRKTLELLPMRRELPQITDEPADSAKFRRRRTTAIENCYVMAGFEQLPDYVTAGQTRAAENENPHSTMIKAGRLARPPTDS
jgi:hypothetical protein